jgi:hypothetical protein
MIPGMPVPRRPALVTSSRLLATVAATLLAAACAAAQPMPAARAFGTLKANVPQVSNGNLTRELRIHWTAPRSSTQGASTSSTNSFTLLGQVRFSGAPRRERQPEPSANDLVIVVQDAAGRDLDWRIIPNPRLIRSETPDRSGLLSGQLIERDEVELLVYVPDVAGAERIQIFSPVWNGQEFTLAPLGQLTIGGAP